MSTRERRGELEKEWERECEERSAKHAEAIAEHPVTELLKAVERYDHNCMRDAVIYLLRRARTNDIGDP